MFLEIPKAILKALQASFDRMYLAVIIVSERGIGSRLRAYLRVLVDRLATLLV